MSTEQNGTNHLGVWTPAQYIEDCGWFWDSIEATALLGVADADAEELTEEQQAELVEYCRMRVDDIKIWDERGYSKACE